MIPQTPDFFQLFSQDHNHREAVAEAERFRTQHVSSASASPRTTRLVHRPHTARAG